MGRKRKTRKQEEDKEPEDLLSWASNLSHVTIYGRSYPRIRYDGSEGKSCPGCHHHDGELHECSCPKEICPMCKGISIDCKCDPDVSNADKDLYMECYEDLV